MRSCEVTSSPNLISKFLSVSLLFVNLGFRGYEEETEGD